MLKVKFRHPAPLVCRLMSFTGEKGGSHRHYGFLSLCTQPLVQARSAVFTHCELLYIERGEIIKFDHSATESRFMQIGGVDSPPRCFRPTQ